MVGKPVSQAAIVRTGQIAPRAIASILRTCRSAAETKACPLVFGRDGDAARTSNRLGGPCPKPGKQHERASGRPTLPTKLVGATMLAKRTQRPTLGSGAGDSDPAERPARRLSRVRSWLRWAGFKMPAPTVRIQIMLTALVRDREPARRVALLLSDRHPRTEHRSRHATVTHVRGGTRLCPASPRFGAFTLTRRTVQALRWAIEDGNRLMGRRTILAPWRSRRGPPLMFWGVGTALLTTLYGP